MSTRGSTNRARARGASGSAKVAQPTMRPEYVLPKNWSPATGAKLTPEQQWAFNVIEGRNGHHSILSWTPDERVANSLRLYGPEQLASVLRPESLETLRQMPGARGRSKAEVLANVVAHATGRGESPTARTPAVSAPRMTPSAAYALAQKEYDAPALSKAAKGETSDAKVARLSGDVQRLDDWFKDNRKASAAAQDAVTRKRENLSKQVDKLTSGGAKTAKATAAGAGSTRLTPIARIQGREFDISARPDPGFLRALYGDDQLRVALSRYPMAALREAARIASEQSGRKVSAGTSRATAVENIYKAATREPYDATLARYNGTRVPKAAAASRAAKSPAVPSTRPAAPAEVPPEKRASVTATRDGYKVTYRKPMGSRSVLTSVGPLSQAEVQALLKQHGLTAIYSAR